MNPNSYPVPKVRNAALAGAVVVVLSFVVDIAGLDVPPAVSASATVVVAAVVGWFAPRA